MLLKGEALINTFTIGFAVHGERGEWKASISAPGQIVLERETREASPYRLLEELLAAAFDACCKRFPERAPRTGVKR